MGFAVVAGEVRSLALRSAQAAQETTALIEEAPANTQQGGERVARVKGAIEAIVASAGRVRGLVEQVSAASGRPGPAADGGPRGGPGRPPRHGRLAVRRLNVVR